MKVAMKFWSKIFNNDDHRLSLAAKGKKTHTHTEKPKQKVVDVSICMEFVKSDFNGERIFFHWKIFVATKSNGLRGKWRKKHKMMLQVSIQLGQ